MNLEEKLLVGDQNEMNIVSDMEILKIWNPFGGSPKSNGEDQVNTEREMKQNLEKSEQKLNDVIEQVSKLL